LTRVSIIVEGQSEESFISNVLAPSLWGRSIFIQPFVLGVPGHKGGRVNYARVRKDIILQLKQQRATYCTTMFDLYGLGGDFPGMPVPTNLRGPGKADFIERAIYEDITSGVPDLRPDLRFLPYLQVHEYEALLFSDPDALARALRKESLSQELNVIRRAVATPEDINEDANTAPSKRIEQLYRSYKKVIEGTIAAREVGLEVMRQECPRFNAWVNRLEETVPLE
jgi:Domain of unknown function (DUF4276)